MAKREFTKMQGCGNDYIYFDCVRGAEIENPNDLAIRLSDRHFGIGGDGIILICKSDKADAKMRMFNLDGSEGKMCGNGIRCVAKYCYDNKIVTKKDFKIDTLSGIKDISVQKEENGVAKLISVGMGNAILTPKDIPVTLDGDKIVDRAINVGGKEYKITCVSMGNPHCVTFVDDVTKIEIEKIGPLFENNEIFPERVNTEFIQVIDSKTLKMRVWERGSGETWACGTGACASAVAACLNGFAKEGDEITVKLLGGDLKIVYKDGKVTMTGAAETVFEGFVEV
ncbi:MAG: diaminopimelate epimerase [Clostridia bacterium]|nr:diaminopimelate epimerase [Clostridia bacterium]